MAVTIKKQETKEQQRRLLALIISVLISLGIVILLYLIKVNFFDYPPKDFEYGMQVSYGTDDVGSGENTASIDDFINNDNTSENNNPNQDANTENIETTEESPISDTRVNTSENNTKPTNKPKEEQNQPPPKKVTTNNQKPSETGQGNDKNQAGNKGKENGINEQGLYEGNGGNGGSSLSLSGWRWEAEPIVKDDSNAEGTIIFDVLVDEEGYFMSVKPRYPGTTVSDKSIVEKYRQAVLKAYLTPDGSSSRTASTSRGIVTYVLKSK